MELKNLLIFSFLLIFSIFAPLPVFAEDKNTPGGIIPKLPKTQNDPVLSDGRVYPFWGPPCQRYTYSVIYRDKEGRKPEYVKIYFNGKMIDMNPAFATATAGEADYRKGLRYQYKYHPSKDHSKFLLFRGLKRVRQNPRFHHRLSGQWSGFVYQPV